MRTLIIYESIHHGNTEKVVKVIANVLEAKLAKPKELDINTVAEYDLIGFGSGIYGWKHHKDLLNTVDKLSSQKNKRAFIFRQAVQGKRLSIKTTNY
jgi:Flavodoxins